MEERSTKDKRRQLVDLAKGGDGIVGPVIEELDPPQVIDGHAYAFRVVEPTPTKRDPDARVYKYVDTRDQAEKLLHIGDLAI